MKPPGNWPTTRITLLSRLRDTADGRAWHAFVELYKPLIIRYCRRRGLQDADSQNVAQEVFSRVSLAIRSFDYDPDRGRFRNWLGLITHQQMLRCCDKLNSIGRGSGAGAGDKLCNELSGEVEAAWIAEFNAHIYRVAVARIRSQFDDATWMVFEQVWEAGENAGEVARRLQRQPGWVYQAKFKVVQTLKAEISRLSADAAVLYR